MKMQTQILFDSSYEKEVDWWIRVTAQATASRIENVTMISLAYPNLLDKKKLNIALSSLFPGLTCEKLKDPTVSIWKSTIFKMADILNGNPITKELFQGYVREYSGVPKSPTKDERISELEALVERLKAELEVAQKVSRDKERRRVLLKRRKRSKVVVLDVPVGVKMSLESSLT